MNGIFDIVLFAIFAVFIISKLINVLGKTEFDEEEMNRPQKMDQAKTIEVPYEEIKEEDYKGIEARHGKDVAEKIKMIRKEDPYFTEENFLVGAKKAFEMIVNAFAKGDKNTLKPLLSEGVYKSFEREIDDRKNRQEIDDLTLVSIHAPNIKNISVDRKYAQIELEIISEQINLVKDKSGKVIEGDPSHVSKIKEIWTFGRNLNSQNPNWELTNISSEK